MCAYGECSVDHDRPCLALGVYVAAVRDDTPPVSRIADEGDELQAATLTVVLELHPTLLTEEELIREIAGDPKARLRFG